MLFSDSVTAVTKIVLRSQWGWCGGVKKLFKWINSPSLLFPAASLACVWLSLSKAHIAGVYLSLYCLRRNMSRFKRSDGWPCCIWRCRPVVLDFAQGAVYFLVRDFIHILYSLLTPSPPMIALYTASHIPATNAFFFRSLPSSRLGAVSNRSIRNAGLPAVPVVWPLLTGGEEALIG